jgi:hypothetical protein
MIKCYQVLWRDIKKSVAFKVNALTTSISQSVHHVFPPRLPTPLYLNWHTHFVIAHVSASYGFIKTQYSDVSFKQDGSVSGDCQCEYWYCLGIISSIAIVRVGRTSRREVLQKCDSCTQNIECCEAERFQSDLAATSCHVLEDTCDVLEDAQPRHSPTDKALRCRETSLFKRIWERRVLQVSLLSESTTQGQTRCIREELNIS